MAVFWRLKELLQSQGIANASEFHRCLKSELGIQISTQALAKLIRQDPTLLKIETVQIICTLLQVPLHEYLIITPEPKVKSTEIIQPFGNKTLQNETVFIDPKGFF